MSAPIDTPDNLLDEPCRCGKPDCDLCFEPESEPWIWDEATIADMRFHLMHDEGEI